MKENGIEVDLEERENWGKPKRSRGSRSCEWDVLYACMYCIVLYVCTVLYERRLHFNKK